MEKTNSGPGVSVLMAVWQAEKTLERAINSILSQSYTNFEFLIVDDASTDNTGNILARSAENDSRVHVFTNQRNIGLTSSLNFLLDNASGNFIARMDADDIALPNRLQEQVDYLKTHKEYAGCGSWVADIHNPRKILRMPADDTAIRKSMICGNSFIHPSIVLRRDFLVAHNIRYNESYPIAQDYELWARILPVARMTNIPKVLLRYNQSGDRLTARKRALQLTYTRKIRRKFLKRLFPQPEIQTILQKEQFTVTDINTLNRFLKPLPQHSFQKKLNPEFLYALWHSLSRYGLYTLWIFISHYAFASNGLSFQQRKKILLRHFFPGRYKRLL